MEESDNEHDHEQQLTVVIIDDLPTLTKAQLWKKLKNAACTSFRHLRNGGLLADFKTHSDASAFLLHPPPAFEKSTVHWPTRKKQLQNVPPTRQAILRRVDTSHDEADIKDSLRELTPDEVEVTRFKFKGGVPMETVLLTFTNEDVATSLVQQGRLLICGERLKIEPRGHCWRCRQTGHRPANCPKFSVPKLAPAAPPRHQHVPAPVAPSQRERPPLRPQSYKQAAAPNNPHIQLRAAITHDDQATLKELVQEMVQEIRELKDQVASLQSQLTNLKNRFQRAHPHEDEYKHNGEEQDNEVPSPPLPRNAQPKKRSRAEATLLETSDSESNDEEDAMEEEEEQETIPSRNAPVDNTGHHLRPSTHRPARFSQ